MIRGRRIRAIVPARGGSKSIPRKNLYRINGITLVERALRLAKASRWVDDVYVSTDDPETYAIAAQCGCATPALRPAHLSDDRARTIDVIRHLVAEGIVGTDDCVLLLQPTSPLRTLDELNAVCDQLAARWDTADAVVSVSKIEGPHPYKAQVVNDGYLRSLLARDAAVPRQSLPVTYLPNGAFYLGKYDVLASENTFMPRRSIPFIMSAERSINLDGPLDLVLLEALLEKGIVNADDGIPPMSAA